MTIKKLLELFSLWEEIHKLRSLYNNYIEVFIDLNTKTKHNLNINCDVAIFYEGILICSLVYL